ncbi:hypothetical protein CEP53_015305 [Fusarium sp. AF-6]|nr:hypothetical protein CEP53_015305 [Fusarium sp. AF-6]
MSTNSGLPTVSVQNGQSAHPLNTPSTRMLGAWNCCLTRRGAKISALRRGRGLPRHSHSRATIPMILVRRVHILPTSQP